MALDDHGVECCGSERRHKYEVFLSFRGEDTRKKFTDHLYNALRRDGLMIAFRDEEELERGEAIKPSLVQAIEESFSAIVVLSKNYANSRWCLDELVKILDSKKLGLHVFPVFYEEDPSDVRHQRGSFAEAFEKHEQIFGDDKLKVQRWRDALKEVVDLAGWSSEHYLYESELIEDVVKKVRSKLYGHPQFNSNDERLVGVDEKIAEFDSFLGHSTEEVRFIGIWGMGGLGKTTLARAVYEGIKQNYDISFFLHNVREKSTTDSGLIELQKELLSHQSWRTEIKVGDCYKGRELIERRLSNRKVLLVLDDVSDMRQLENLAKKKGWFGKGSRIIITTRDQRLLSSHGVVASYEMNFLTKDESLQLFRQKAFKEDQPDEDFWELSNAVAQSVKGLPLAIKVIGLFLCGRGKQEWEEALEKIGLSEHDHLFNTLKVSFDLKMHHSKLKQLWTGTQFLPCLKFIDLSDSKNLIRTPNCNEIPNLQRLILQGCTSLVEVHHSLGQHRKLVIVDFEDCLRIETLPTKLEMNSLEKFVLSGCSRVENLPEFGDGMERLSELHLMGTAISKLPQSLVNLTGLALLDLSFCKNLGSLQCVFQTLKGIMKMLIFRFPKFSRLPENLNDSLEVLNVGGSAIVELLSSLNNLKQLYLSGCNDLISSSIRFLWCPPFSDLSSLVFLDLSHSNLDDESLPSEFSNLSSLTTLFLGRNNFVELPSGLISKLRKLEVVAFDGCPRLRSLPQLPSNLSIILASDCPLLEDYVCPQQLREFIQRFDCHQTRVWRTHI